jgi:hypothetical protein
MRRSKPHVLVYDLREPGHVAGPKETRAQHSSFEAALEQAQLDLAYGRTVVAIEDVKGRRVWEP